MGQICFIGRRRSMLSNLKLEICFQEGGDLCRPCGCCALWSPDHWHRLHSFPRSLLLQCLIIFPHQFPQAALTHQSLKTGNISLGCRALFTHMENTTIQWGLSTRQVRLRFLFKFGQKIKGCFLIFCSVESLSSFG